MSYTTALLTGIAEDLRALGWVYNEDGLYAASDRGVVLQTFPETPNELMALSVYSPVYTYLGPTAPHCLASTMVQFRWRVASRPLDGIRIVDSLVDRYGRRSGSPFGSVTANTDFKSFTPMGEDANRRWQFSANFAFSGLRWSAAVA